MLRKEDPNKTGCSETLNPVKRKAIKSVKTILEDALKTLNDHMEDIICRCFGGGQFHKVLYLC
jgi:hypothetical protein